MGGILIRRFFEHALTAEIRALDPYPRNRETLEEYVIEWYEEGYSALAQSSDVLVLAIKPQDFPSVAARLRGSLGDVEAVISIMAGTSIVALQSARGTEKIVRIMPNIAAAYGQAAVAICVSDAIEEGLTEYVSSLIATLGHLFPLPEEAFDAFTAISGSGIAFVLQVIDALTRGGVNIGFRAEVAERIIIETCRGAIALLAAQGRHPQELIRSICSAGGTTIAGIAALEEGGLNAALMNAALATMRRAKEMAEG